MTLNAHVKRQKPPLSFSAVFDKSSFDLLICWGNSFCHTTGAGDRRGTLGVFRRLLKDSGRVIVHSRDWEGIMASRPRYTVMEVQNYQGRKCLPIYIWNWTGFDRVNTVDVVFQFINDDLTVDTEAAIFEFTPFKKDALLREMEGEGFEIGEINTGDDGFYYISVIKARNG